MQHLYRGRFVNFQSLNIAQFVINSKINSHRKTERNTVIFFQRAGVFLRNFDD